MTTRSRDGQRDSPPAGSPEPDVQPGRRSGRLVVARHRSPRGRRAHQTLSFPLVASTGGSGARRAPSDRVLPGRILGVPVPVRRGVAVAAVAGGALAAAGAAAAALSDADAGGPVLALAADRAAVAPVPGGAVVSPGGAAPLTVPVPVTAGPPRPAPPHPPRPSPAGARAQGKAPG